jgi:hypothetical protein
VTVSVDSALAFWVSKWSKGLSLNSQRKRRVLSVGEKKSGTVVALFQIHKLFFAGFGYHRLEALHADRIPGAIRVFPMVEIGFGNCVERNALET